MKGYVHSLESFGSVDGPGVRYVIFLSGCAMRCQFCHNPDTWKMGQGQEYTADELLSKALRYTVYWGNKGGITVSGGEPLLQIDFLTELFKKAKAAGVHTTLDTSANPFTDKEPWHSKWLELMKYTDLVLLDINVNITIIYFSGRSGNGSNLPEIETATYYRNACNRNCAGTVCPGFS